MTSLSVRCKAAYHSGNKLILFLLAGPKDKRRGETDKSQPDLSSLAKKPTSGSSFASRLMALREAKAKGAPPSGETPLGSNPASIRRAPYEDPIIVQRRLERLERERGLIQSSGNTTSTLPSKESAQVPRFTLQSPRESPIITQRTPERLERESNHPLGTAIHTPPSEQAPQIIESAPRTAREDPTIAQRRLERLEREKRWMSLSENRTSTPDPVSPSETVVGGAESILRPPRVDPTIAQRRQERFEREKSMYPARDFTPTPIPRLSTSPTTPSGAPREDPTIAQRRAARLERERLALLKNLEPRPRVNKNAQGSGDEISYSRPFASRASLQPTGTPAPGTGKHNIKTKERERIRNAKHRPKLIELESMPVGPPDPPERPEITFNDLDSIFKSLSLSQIDTFVSWKHSERALEIRGGNYSDFAPPVVDFNKQPKLDLVTLARFTMAKNRDITLNKRGEVLKIVGASVGTSVSARNEVHV